MGNIYIGNSSNTASKVVNAYVGVDGVAKKIKAVYIGVDNIAKLVWQSTIKKFSSYVKFTKTSSYTTYSVSSSYSTVKYNVGNLGTSAVVQSKKNRNIYYFTTETEMNGSSSTDKTTKINKVTIDDNGTITNVISYRLHSTTNASYYCEVFSICEVGDYLLYYYETGNNSNGNHDNYIGILNANDLSYKYTHTLNNAYGVGAHDGIALNDTTAIFSAYDNYGACIDMLTYNGTTFTKKTFHPTKDGSYLKGNTGAGNITMLTNKVGIMTAYDLSTTTLCFIPFTVSDDYSSITFGKLHDITKSEYSNSTSSLFRIDDTHALFAGENQGNDYVYFMPILYNNGALTIGTLTSTSDSSACYEMCQMKDSNTFIVPSSSANIIMYYYDVDNNMLTKLGEFSPPTGSTIYSISYLKQYTNTKFISFSTETTKTSPSTTKLFTCIGELK